MEKIFWGIEDPNIYSYSRWYYFWKRGTVIYRLFTEEAERRNKPLIVLDTGCGTGRDLFYINSIFGKSCRFVGVDISENHIKFCNRARNTREISNLYFFVGDLTKLSFKDGSFDVVICSEVLEHLLDPIQALFEIRRVLKKGGITIITTPNRTNFLIKISDFFRKLGLWKNKKIDTESSESSFSGQQDFGHVSVKGLSEWIEIFYKAKFKIVAVKRGSLIFGGFSFDYHNFLFAFLIIIDILLDHVPFVQNFTETLIVKLQKKYE